MIKETSIKHFGFYTSRPSRTAEYEWVLDEIEGPNVCDIGAGTSPLPIILAERGFSVDTVDYWNEKTSNEWGFVDYSIINDLIRSYNVDFSTFDGGPYDAVYSISAIEHMPAVTRQKVFKKAYDLLTDDGIFLITMDVKQGTKEIHNRNYGKIIEDDHGTLADIMDELHEYFNGILVFTESFKGQGQDVLFIKAVK